ncbi:Uncharacterized protein DAT39_014851, partial [Clarias magur]
SLEWRRATPVSAATSWTTISMATPRVWSVVTGASGTSSSRAEGTDTSSSST